MQLMENTLTHLDARGNARMVDVSEKAETVMGSSGAPSRASW